MEQGKQNNPKFLCDCLQKLLLRITFGQHYNFIFYFISLWNKKV